MRFRFLSGSALKVLAVLCMLADHTAIILLSDYTPAHTSLFSLFGQSFSLHFLLTQIGRLAFPLFGFLITEGYLHTRNKLRYGLMLLLFAFLSEVPFDLMINHSLFSLEKQNIYFTLALGVFGIWVSEAPKSEFLRAIGLLLMVFAATVLHPDFGVRGVVFIVLIYHLRKHPAAQAILSFPLLSGGYAAACAFIPINLYNGKRGFIRGRVSKYFFYLFYPAHILLLLAIRQYL